MPDCECDLGKVLDLLVQDWMTVRIGFIEVDCAHGKWMRMQGVEVDRRKVDAATNT